MSAENRPQEMPFPMRVEPLEPRIIRSGPNDESNWIGELKLDGMRGLIIQAPEKPVIIRTKQGTIINNRVFPRLKDGFEVLAENHSFILDGEIIAGMGRTQEERDMVLDRAKSKGPAFITPEEMKFSYAAFDILYLGDQDLRELPIEERKEILKNFIPKNFEENFGIFVLDYFDNLDIVKEFAEKEGFEGAVFKKRGSKYKKTPQVPSPWAKLKFRTDTFQRGGKK